METKVTSATKEVIIGGNRPTVLIGERINPAGNKKLGEAVKNNDLSSIPDLAVAQVKAGADMVDVHMGAFGADEVTLLPKAVQMVMEAVDVPICIDSHEPAAIEAALKVYKGKPLVNSFSGESKSIDAILPLIKEYGAAVVGLTQDDEGVPKDRARRVAVAKALVERAEKMGIPREDVIIDCLAFAVGADTTSGPEVLAAIKQVRDELGVNQTLGASNISFGLPNREVLNAAFNALIIEHGVTCLITNVRRARPVALSVDLLLGRDKRGMRYIQANRPKRTA